MTNWGWWCAEARVWVLLLLQICTNGKIIHLTSMEQKGNQSTVRERFRDAVALFRELDESAERQDQESFQRKLASLLKEFDTIQSLVNSLALFSDNEKLKEVSTSYLPFATVPYYLACLYMKLLADILLGFAFDKSDLLKHKLNNLQRAKVHTALFLHQLEAFGGVLTEEQTKRIDSFANSYNPSIEEITALGNAVTQRAEKIANFKKERELQQKLLILDQYYKTSKNEHDDEDILRALDEDVVRAVYIDQLKLFSLYSFKNLELIAMELQVLLNRPAFEKAAKQDKAERPQEKDDDFGYTTRVESNPNRKKKISELISAQGKILQPFTITSDKQELRKKVFGTGQVLPSMSVEEYLDYELANGKMLKPESNDNAYQSSDEDDSDEEIRKREWDDWKDDNPKGSGNMKANIG